jgi:hypothetical protein
LSTKVSVTPSSSNEMRVGLVGLAALRLSSDYGVRFPNGPRFVAGVSQAFVATFAQSSFSSVVVALCVGLADLLLRCGRQVLAQLGRRDFPM